MTDTPETFTCDRCHQTFDKGWSDAEAEAEAVEQFGEYAKLPRAVVCDDCYRKMNAEIPPKEWRP